MFVKKLFNSDKLYAFANLFFAGSNAITSILIVKFFGHKVYGLMSYYNSIDMFVDYLSGHSRSTFEYSIASSHEKKRVIQSFALMQLILCFVSILVFFGMSFFTEDQTSLIICQIFIFLSPGKSYISFFRILSKVTAKLKWFTLLIILLSIVNILVIFLSYFYFDFYAYLSVRSISLIVFSLILAYIFSLNFQNLKSRLMLVFNELRLKSKSLLIYSFIKLLTLAFDKLIIKHIFGDTTLGVYSLAFLAYSMLMIFGGSLIGGNFKKLTNCIPQDYYIVLSKTTFWIISMIIIIEILITSFINFEFFLIYKDSVTYMFWFLPCAFISIFIHASYIYMISKNYLSSFNKGFFLVTLLYIIFSILLSIKTGSSQWFSILFLFHQIILVFYLSSKFDFLAVAFKKSI